MNATENLKFAVETENVSALLSRIVGRNWTRSKTADNFPRKVSIDISQIRGNRIKREEKKENELVFFRKLTLLKSNSVVVSSYFVFWSL